MPSYYEYEMPCTPSFDGTQSTWMDCEVVTSQAFGPSTPVINVAGKLNNIVRETDDEIDAVLTQVKSSQPNQPASSKEPKPTSGLAEFEAPVDVAPEPNAEDGDGGAAGKNAQRHVDAVANMRHTMVPSNGSVFGKTEMLQLMEDVAEVTGKSDDDDEGGHATYEGDDGDEEGPIGPSSARALIHALDETETDIGKRLGGIPNVWLDKRRSGRPLKRPQLDHAHPASSQDVTKAPRLSVKVDLFSPEGRKGLLQKAFPTLIHSNHFDYFTENLVDNTVKHIAKEEVLRYLLQCTDEHGHRPFAEHPTAVYALLNMNFRLNVNQVKGVVAGRGYAGKTVAELLDDVKDKNSAAFNNLHAFASSFPGTPGFWFQFREQAKAIGYFKEWQTDCCETIFYTLTAANNWWASFFEKSLPEDVRFHSNDTVDSTEDTQLRQELSAVHSARAVEYYRLVKNIFVECFLCDGIGMESYWDRIEYQSRTAGHDHGCGYIPGAPSMDVLQRACDGFQRFDSTNMPKRALLEATDEQKQALAEVIEWIMANLPITGRYPSDCRRCQPKCHGNKHGLEKDKTRNNFLKWKYSKLGKKQRLHRLKMLKRK